MIDVLTWGYFNYIMALAIVIVTLVGTKILMHFFERYLEAFAARTKTKVDDLIIKTVKRPLYFIILLLGVYLAFVHVKFPFLEQTELGLKIIGAILGTWAAYRVIPALIEEYGRSLAQRTESKIDDVIVPVVEKIAKIFLVIIGLLIILDLLRIDVTPMIAGMGIAGIAIALALQDTLSNMFSGFYLMIDRPFKLGDRLVLDTGELCEVRDVGLRSTRLYNVIDHTLITIPNAELSKMKLTNISEPDIKLKLRIPIGVAYGSDIDKVKRVLLEIAKEAPDVLDDPPPIAVFNEFADFSLNLLLIVWISDIKGKIVVVDYINSRIKKRFEEENIEIPFPIRTLYIQKEK